MSLGLLIGYICIANSFDFPSLELLGVGTAITNFSIAAIAFLITPLIAGIPNYLIRTYIAIFKPGLREIIAVSPVGKVEVEFNRLETYSSGLKGVYKISGSWKSGVDFNKFDMGWNLKFVSQFTEKIYKDHYIRDHILIYRIVLGIILGILIIWTLYEGLVVDASIDYTIIRVLMTLAFSAVFLLVFLDYFKRHYVYYTVLVIFIAIALIFVTDIGYKRLGLLSTAVVPAVSYILFNVDAVKITLLNILNVVLFFIGLVVFYVTSDAYNDTEKALLILTAFILLTAISVTSAKVGWHLDKNKRQEHKLMNIAESGVEKIQTILGYLLPAFVRNRVKKGVRYIAEDQGRVTILFCDIYDFDRICKEYSPIELTTFLDNVFQRWDQLCDSIGVSKIETVGKTYMACAGLKDSELEMSESLKKVSHARRTIEMGLAIIRDLNSIKLKYGGNLQVKIGINSGPVTAGVVGHHKPQFSLVGDTVNTASRMCSTIEETNIIQITEDTHKLLESLNGLKLIPNQIEAKGKGIMNTFLLTETQGIEIEEETLPVYILTGNQNPNEKNDTTVMETEETPQDLKKLIKRLPTKFDMKTSKDVFKKNDPDMIKNVSLFDFSCKKETDIQKIFRIQHTQDVSATVLFGLITALISFSCLLIISILENEYLEDYSNENIIIMRATVVLCLLLLIVFHKKLINLKYYALLTVPVQTLMLIIDLLSIIYTEKLQDDFVALEIMYIIVILNHTSNISFSFISLMNLGLFIAWVVVAALSSNSESQVANVGIVFGFAVINTSAACSREIRVRINYNLQKMAEREIKETDKLLVQMMPPHVLENMKNDKAITDKLTDVTLLFADIVGFTAWSSDKTPKKVVKMLSELFSLFDKKCVELNVYKVHTIGDCYVVMGYNGSANRDIGSECINMLKMAQEMIQIINEVNALHGSVLNMRVGLHTGDVIAGITGTNIVRYDIYGPDVLIANKMESGGRPGDINVSDVTRAILEKKMPGELEYEFNKEISAKACDRCHQSYFITPKI